eukprot:9977121-Lingulodinium_polyedra.AAC.1
MERSLVCQWASWWRALWIQENQRRRATRGPLARNPSWTEQAARTWSLWAGSSVGSSKRSLAIIGYRASNKGDPVASVRARSSAAEALSLLHQAAPSQGP